MYKKYTFQRVRSDISSYDLKQPQRDLGIIHSPNEEVVMTNIYVISQLEAVKVAQAKNREKRRLANRAPRLSTMHLPDRDLLQGASLTKSHYVASRKMMVPDSLSEY